MESLYIVNSKNKTKLFDESNLSELARRGCRIIYAVVSKIPNCDCSECSTIGIALTPEEATSICKISMGDFIEVWVLDDNGSIGSEKWEPKYFKKNFVKLAHIRDRQKEEQIEEQEEPLPDEPPDEPMDEQDVPDGMNGMTINDLLRNLFLAMDKLRQITVVGSYSFGHPMDLEPLVCDVGNAIGRIIYNFLYTTGGHTPKFKKNKDGTTAPYWTKKQIEDAKIITESR